MTEQKLLDDLLTTIYVYINEGKTNEAEELSRIYQRIKANQTT